MTTIDHLPSRIRHTGELRIASARVALLGAGAFTFVHALSFVRTFAELNVNPPTTASVVAWVINGFIAATATLALLVWAMRPTVLDWSILVPSAMLGLGNGVLLSDRLMSSLGPDGHLEWMGWASSLLLLPLLGFIAWLAALAMDREALGRRLLGAALAAHALNYVGLALSMLANLEALEAQARLVSPTPAWGLLAAATALATAAFLSGRRERARRTDDQKD